MGIDQYVDIFIKLASDDGDKKLKVEEVIRILGDADKKDPKVKSQILFRMCDKDGDGFISTKELTKVVKFFVDVTEDDDFGMMIIVNMLMLMVDKDEDGKLNYEEFCDVLENTTVTPGDQIKNQSVVDAIKAADKDENGYLTANELKELFLKVQPEDKEGIDQYVDTFIKLASDDGDKKLKVEEVIRILGDADKKDPKVKSQILFRMCDKDGDGFISTKELTKVVKFFADVTEDDDFGMMIIVNMLMLMVEKDEDGKIHYEEFCDVLENTTITPSE